MKIVVASWDDFVRYKIIIDDPIETIFTVVHPEGWLNDEDGKPKYLWRRHQLEGKYFRFDQVKNFVIHGSY